MTETGGSSMRNGGAAVLGMRTPASAPSATPAVAIGRAEGAAGESERFDGIVRRHERTVLALARRLLGRLEDAEDAAQESFLRLYRALDRLDPERPVLPYLYRTTVNVCRDLQARGRGRRLRDVSLGEVAPEDEPEAGGADPAEAARLSEERRIAAAALRALPEKQRTALVLRDLHGLSTGEVAEVLGVAEVTVRTQISRARLKVKEFRDRALGSEGRKS